MVRKNLFRWGDFLPMDTVARKSRFLIPVIGLLLFALPAHASVSAYTRTPSSGAVLYPYTQYTISWTDDQSECNFGGGALAKYVAIGVDDGTSGSGSYGGQLISGLEPISSHPTFTVPAYAQIMGSTTSWTQFHIYYFGSLYQMRAGNNPYTYDCADASPSDAISSWTIEPPPSSGGTGSTTVNVYGAISYEEIIFLFCISIFPGWYAMWHFFFKRARQI